MMATAISKKIYSQHVADKGKEIIEIIIHRAINIPVIKGKSLISLDHDDLSSKPNATKPILSSNPEWNDIIFVETLEENVQNDELLLLIIDENSKNQLAEFKLPWRQLMPFYQYNMMLTQSDKKKKAELKLFVSLTRKQSHLSKREMPSYGLEVFLNRIEDNLTEKNALYAVARVVPNFHNYLEDFLKNGESEVVFDQVNFPMNFNTQKTFSQPKDFNLQGYPQIIMACENGFTPTWEQNYLFSSIDENESLFNRDTGLFIEFFPFKKTEGTSTFKIKDLSGWCALKLDQRFKVSINDSEFGVKSDSLLIEGDGSLTSQFSQKISVEIGLKIIRNKCPKKMTFNLNTLPVLNSHYTEENVHLGVEPLYLQKKGYLKKLNILMDEVEDEPPNSSVKKESQNNKSGREDFTKFLQPNKKSGPREEAITRAENQLLPKREDVLYENFDDFSDIPMDYRYTLLNLNTPKDDDLKSWVKYYRNLSRLYRTMVKQMDQEIVAYRHQIKNLKNELSTKLTKIDEKKAALLKIVEINDIDRTNLNKAFLELKTRLAMKNNENINLRDQISVLERKLERKINTDRELEKMTVAQVNQNKELQAMQKKVNDANTLEETVSRQNAVIEKLEDFIHKLVNDGKEKTAEYYDYVRARSNH